MCVSVFIKKEQVEICNHLNLCDSQNIKTKMIKKDTIFMKICLHTFYIKFKKKQFLLAQKHKCMQNVSHIILDLPLYILTIHN